MKFSRRVPALRDRGGARPDAATRRSPKSRKLGTARAGIRRCCRPRRILRHCGPRRVLQKKKLPATDRMMYLVNSWLVRNNVLGSTALRSGSGHRSLEANQTITVYFTRSKFQTLPGSGPRFRRGSPGGSARHGWRFSRRPEATPAAPWWASRRLLRCRTAGLRDRHRRSP